MDREKLEQLLQFNKEQERKRLFQEVAIQTIGKQQATSGNYAYEYFWQRLNAEQIANEILQASEDFAKEIE